MPEARRAALITGGSTGIGLALARLFAAHGAEVALVARDAEKLRAAAAGIQKESGTAPLWFARDLARPESALEILEWCRTQNLFVETLVNNAGFGHYGPFAHSEWRRDLEMMQVNMVSLTHLTKLFLEDMIHRREGKILNVASTAAFQPGPLMAVYYATKAFVLSYSEALRNELRGTGVHVSVLCPGPTHTGFQGRAGMGNVFLFRHAAMTSEAVARAAYEGLLRRKGVIIPGMRNRLLAFAVRFAPRGLAASAVRWVQEIRGKS